MYDDDDKLVVNQNWFDKRGHNPNLETCYDGNYEADLKQDVPGVFDDSTELGKSRWGDLKKRVVEHNIRIMATYYTKISLKRMAFLLSLTEAEAEDFLSTMVVNKTVEAKTGALILTICT